MNAWKCIYGAVFVVGLSASACNKSSDGTSLAQPCNNGMCPTGFMCVDDYCVPDGFDSGVDMGEAEATSFATLTGVAETDTGEADTTGADTTGADTTGEPQCLPVPEECWVFIDCIAAIVPSQSEVIEDQYGEGGACWCGTEEEALVCFETCITEVEKANEMFPDEPACQL